MSLRKRRRARLQIKLRWQHHLRSHRLEMARAFIEAALESFRDIRVERIRRRVRRQRAITPVLVHPKPGRGIFPDVGLELIPASLRHFLKRGVHWKFDPGMKHNAVTSRGQRLAMHVDHGRAGASMRPGMSEAYAGFQSETIQ